MAPLYNSMSYDEYHPYKGTIGKGNMRYPPQKTDWKPYKETIGPDNMKYRNQPFKGSINQGFHRNNGTRQPQRLREPAPSYERAPRRPAQSYEPYRPTQNNAPYRPVQNNTPYRPAQNPSKHKPYESNIRWKPRQEPFQGYQPKLYKGEMVNRPYKYYELPEDYYGFKRRRQIPRNENAYVPPQAAPVRRERNVVASSAMLRNDDRSVLGPTPKRKTPPRNPVQRNSPPVSDPLTEANRASARTPVYNTPAPVPAPAPASRKPQFVSPPPPPHHQEPTRAARTQAEPAVQPVAAAPRPQKNVRINQVEPKPIQITPRAPVRAPQRHPLRMSDPISPFPPATPPPDSMFQSRYSPDRFERKPKAEPMFPPLIPLQALNQPKGVVVARIPSPSWAVAKPNGNPLIPVMSANQLDAKVSGYPNWSMPDQEHWEHTPRYSKLPDYNAAGSVLRSSAIFGY